MYVMHECTEDSSKRDSLPLLLAQAMCQYQVYAPSPCLTYKGLHISLKMLSDFHADEVLRNGEESGATQAPFRLQTAASDAATDYTFQVRGKKQIICAQLLICVDQLSATTMPWLHCFPVCLSLSMQNLSVRSGLLAYIIRSNLMLSGCLC